MMRREPTEIGGTLLPGPARRPRRQLRRLHAEAQEAAKQGLDLNRNFPASWRQEFEQLGAGPYPTSEPEVRAVVDFIARHTNLTGGTTFHTWSGVLLRPFEHLSDDEMDAEDLWVYQTVGKKGTELTGYPVDLRLPRVPLPPEAGDRRHVRLDLRAPRPVLVGGRDLVADARGRHHGVQVHRLVPRPPGRGRPEAHAAGATRSSAGSRTWRGKRSTTRSSGGRASAAGTASTRSPIRRRRSSRRSSRAFRTGCVWQALISPKLVLVHAGAQRSPERGAWKVTLVVQNEGWLPSYVSKRALARKVVRGADRRDRAAARARRWSRARLRDDLGQLEGKAYKHTGVSFWPDYNITDDRVKVEWVVAGKAGDTVTLTARTSARAWCARA